MDAVNLLGSPKVKDDSWEIEKVAEIVFDACEDGSGHTSTDDIIIYVKQNWIQKGDNLQESDDQLQRLVHYLDPGGTNKQLNYQQFLDAFTAWVNAEQSALCDTPKAVVNCETYESNDAHDENGTIGSSTTESLLSWDYPMQNGFDHNSLKKENSVLKEQISSAELYNNDLVQEVNELQAKLKNSKDSKLDLEQEFNNSKSEISSLRQESTQWQEYADRYQSKDEFILKTEHDIQVLECNRTIAELTEQISFLRKENSELEHQLCEMKSEQQLSDSMSNMLDHSSLKEELASQQTFAIDHELGFLSQSTLTTVISDSEDSSQLLASCVGAQSLEEFRYLLTSVAKQINRILRSVPPSDSLIPSAEKQLFVDTLQQMAASKHLSEVKIAQLVDLFKKLKTEHSSLGDKHVCLQTDYQTLLAEFDEMRSEIVSITRTNAQLRNEIVAVYDGTMTHDERLNNGEDTMHARDSRDSRGFNAELEDLKKKLKGTEKANLTLTLAIEEQTKQRNALQQTIEELQKEVDSSIGTISKLEGDNKTLTRDNEKLAESYVELEGSVSEIQIDQGMVSETYQRQKADLDELRKEWVGEMDKCSNLETGFNALNLNIVDSLHNLLQLLKPSVSLPSVDANLSLPLEEWTNYLNKEFLAATEVVEEVRLNCMTTPTTTSTIKKSVEVQTVEQHNMESNSKGNLARAACFEDGGSMDTARQATGQADLEALPEVLSNKDDLSNEFQFTTDVAALSRKSVEGEFQAIMLSFENDTFTLNKRLNMHDRAYSKATTNFQTEVEGIRDIVSTIKNDYLPDDKKAQLEGLLKQLNLLPETVETLSASALATGKCQQEDKHARNFEVMIAHNFHTKKALTTALASIATTTDSGMPKRDVDRAAVRKKTLAVAAAMRKDEEKQKEMQASEQSSVFSSFAGVVKNLMVKAPAEPDLANRRATEMMQRMKTVETLGADKEALYKEGFRGGLSSGLHDTFENIKKEQNTCEDNIDSLNKRASKLEREVAFYKKHSNHLFYGGAATPAATLRTVFCTVFINLFVLFILLITVPLPEHSGYTLGTGYISLQEFITSHFLNVPDRQRPLL